MKKFGFRVVIGIVAFGFGICTVWVLVSVLKQQTQQLEKSLTVDNSETQSFSEEKKLYPTSPNGKIEVIFKGFKQTENGLVMESEIINHNSNTVKYSSATKNFPYDDFKFSGKPEMLSYCGVRAKLFELEAGDSFTNKSPISDLPNEYSKQDGEVQIGFGFISKEKNRLDYYWSQKFQIPDDVKAQIRKESIETK